MKAAIAMCRDQSNWFSDFQGCACQLPLRIFANGVRYPTSVAYMELFQTCFPVGRIAFRGMCLPTLKTLVCCSYKVTLHVLFQVLCTVLRLQHGLKYE